MDPLFSYEPLDSETPENPTHKRGYVLPHRNGKPVEPADKDANPAADLIRHKIEALYKKEPSAREELQNVKETHGRRSKHQQYMHELSTSGRSLAEIQTAWHNYYIGLPDDEKHQVWQEFYAANERTPSAYGRYVKEQAATLHQAVVGQHLPEEAAVGHPTDKRSFATVKKQVLHRVRSNSRTKSKAKQHLHSLLFGLATGAIVLVIFLFSFFNEVVIAPFIRPSGQASATPIILGTDAVAPSSSPELIIPKINVQLPVIYDNTSREEAVIQRALEEGVIHYPTTVLPGQRGNAAIFGHSSNNIFNKGKYKFAFVLLHELAPGDLFYLSFEGKMYTYKVYQKRVVKPTETWVLGPDQTKPATVTLITCDPPGTSLNRLVVWGEQINPDPNGNTVSSVDPSVTTNTEELPSNAPTLWSRFWNWLF
jgi:sortase A